MKTESTHYVVDMAWSVLDYYAQQVSAGKMPLAQAQSLAKATLRRERFQNGNYVWINDFASDYDHASHEAGHGG
jgi:hypothetical protein